MLSYLKGWVSNSKHFNALMSLSLKLDFDLNGKSVDVTLFREVIGSLLYLTTS